MVGVFAFGEYAMEFRSLRDAIRGGGGERAERWSLGVVLIAGDRSVRRREQAGARARGRDRRRRLAVFGIGLVLMAAGIGFRWWAMIVLGRFFKPDLRVRSD
jgi:hypothetical protein